ncbi:class I SAM-dependent methyltransferase [Hoeflea sp.]|uniref:class I SAM-dependent methyltransferase n=1 Tax=Hoeflea sp. TaxID=1940281 RepID=UPI0025C1DC34|nr:class I SAM-dependent methyltransferase [Hoeflea sp.]MBU4531614.1 class I SAM-dependent methyltransferase [Alphaproteobacteria bacterium]MBU4544471.1 class I SAM-dependent methyltransferase [Alphaproteobacteria bacterium]MBV1760910.1 class I SAM-dependent methyltransferase [Hoeflea sp.]MBV1783927.1 class I SAM-dependent methyltransferase [Hoeflea sp.]
MKYSLLSFFLPFTRYPYEGHPAACPGCGHDKNTPMAGLDRRLKRLMTVACDHCGLLYTNPMPTDAELNAYYSDFYRFDYQAASAAPKEKHLAKRRHEAAIRVEHLKTVLPAKARTLDFGCGSGEFVSAMLALGHDAHGFEPGETYGSHAQSLHGDRISIKGWEQVRYSERFDLVTCFHVLEHLKNPVDALKQMADWCAPEGRIYVEVPDLGASTGNKGFGALHFAHLLGFNHHNLIVAAARAGLVPEKTISPTGIIFRHGAIDDAAVEAEASMGSALTRALHGKGKMVPSYFRHQYRKITGAYKRQA